MCVCEKYQQKNNKIILKIHLTISKRLKSAVKTLYMIKSRPKKTCTSFPLKHTGWLI